MNGFLVSVRLCACVSDAASRRRAPWDGRSRGREGDVAGHKESKARAYLVVRVDDAAEFRNLLVLDVPLQKAEGQQNAHVSGVGEYIRASPYLREPREQVRVRVRADVVLAVRIVGIEVDVAQLLGKLPHERRVDGGSSKTPQKFLEGAFSARVRTGSGGGGGNSLALVVEAIDQRYMAAARGHVHCPCFIHTHVTKSTRSKRCPFALTR